jgi:hypothetical protein
VPIPEYSPKIEQHRALAKLGAHAEQVAAAVKLPDPVGFQAARRRVREALDADGVANAIEDLVAAVVP